MSNLSERQQKILQAVVVEHVSTAEPVASELITQRYNLGIRSATVRNEMAEITDMGLLEQPHTSAGRVPSDGGYRYYVDHLIQASTVAPKEKSQIRAATNEEEALKEMVVETTRVLSRLTRTLSAALTVRDATLRVRHAAITAMGPERGLIILVLENGHVENRLLDLPPGFTLEDVSRSTEALNRLLVTKTLSEVQNLEQPKPTGQMFERALNSALAIAQVIARDLTRGYLVTEGEEFMFSQPEFIRNPETLSNLVASMQEDATWISTLSGGSGTEPEITIGREHGDQSLSNLSIVKQRFYVGSSEAGTLAIIGPTRMNYDRNVSMLQFTASAISQILTKIFSAR